MDIFVSYKHGLEELLKRLEQQYGRAADSPYHSALVQEQRLRENTTWTELHGDTQDRRAERAEIVGVLNRLALETVGASFNELASLRAPKQMQDLEDRYRESVGKEYSHLDADETPLPHDMMVSVQLRKVYAKLRMLGQDSSLTVTDVLNESACQKLLVWGDGGTGKSVLLRFLAQVYAQRQAYNRLWLPKSENEIIPVLFKLRECSDPDRLWEQILGGATRRFILPSEADIALGLLSEEIVRGRVILLLDGLDEISEREKQRALTEALQQAAYTYPSLRVIVTSSITFARTLTIT